MSNFFRYACLASALFLLASCNLRAEDPKPYGIEKRVLWTTSRVIGSPEPPSPYATEPAFPKLKFDHAVDLVSAPGSDRLFVAEHLSGHIYSFPNRTNAEQAGLFLDLRQEGREIWSLVFHPGYATNGFVYVCYNDKKPKPDRNRVSRFKVDPNNPLRADPESEYVVLEWPTGGHNGGCLQFGRDGYLYISTGDGAGIGDELNTGQFLGDLLGSVLRIDVNRSDLGHAYAIPRDNPFLSVPGARPELWAYGLRNPWKMSFDRMTGDLWLGEVGQDLWDMVYLIKRGGNYGWGFMEGNHVYDPARKAEGPSPISPPVVEHSHSEARSLTGGFVYRGSRLKELRGAYIYADYETGKIWALRYNGERVTEHLELLLSPLHLSAFGEDNDAELYLVSYDGYIHRLVPAIATRRQPHEFPRRLSETGLFTSTKDLQPAPGLIPYDVNSPQWADHADKQRYLALPGDSKIVFQPEGGWDFPEGAVLAQTLSMEMERGNSASRRRLETRLLTMQAGLWRGYTYVWNEPQTDADLLDAAGADRTLIIRDPDGPDGKREQTWRFPSRTECILCHTFPSKWVLGLNTPQMNRDFHYGGVTDNQLRALEHAGIFTNSLPKPPAELPRLVSPDDAHADLTQRARSYLQANCAHCHVDYGGGNSKIRFVYSLPLEKTSVVNALPQHGNFGIEDARILAPGEPGRSVMIMRMSSPGQGRMPRVGSTVVDAAGMKLIYDWIEKVPR